MKNANEIINGVDVPFRLLNGKNDVEVRVVGAKRTSHPLYLTFVDLSVLPNSPSQSQA